MTKADALKWAEQCEQLASTVANADDAAVLREMRQLWLNLATFGDEDGGQIDTEFDRLIAVQSALRNSDEMSN